MEVKQFNPRSLLPFAGAIIVYLVFLKMNGRILNYPRWLTLTTYFAAGGLVFATSLGKLKESYQRDGFQLAMRCFQLLLKTYVLAGGFLIAFNLLNSRQAASAPLQAVHCDITSVSRYAAGNTIFYTLNNEDYHVFGKLPEMDSMQSAMELKQYHMTVYAHAGWLNSLVMERWEVTKR
jgi:hypothetical protein